MFDDKSSGWKNLSRRVLGGFEVSEVGSTPGRVTVRTSDSIDRTRVAVGCQWVAPSVLIPSGVLALVTFALREAGLVTGFVAVAVALACFLFGPGPSSFARRFVVGFAIVFGWFPLLGWVPRLGTTLDVPGIALAFWAGATFAHQRGVRPERVRIRTFPNITEGIGLLATSALVIWWGLPFARLTFSGRIEYFIHSQWDNINHFAIFQSNLKLGSFITVNRQTAHDGPRLGYNYPQGVHQAWAQLVRLWDPTPTLSPHWLLGAYSTLLLLTVGAVVLLGCMAITCLCRRDSFVAIPAMAVVAQFYAFGLFWPFNGFPNFGLAIASAAAAVLLLVRPTLSPRNNFIAIWGLTLAAAYNWYPLAILVAPAAAVAMLRLLRSRSTMRRFRVTVAGVAASLIAVLAPLASISQNGTSFVTVAGGVGGEPWFFLALGIAGLIGIALVRQAVHPNIPANVALAAPAILGGLAVLILVTLEVSSKGTVTYYGKKVATGVVAVLLIILGGVIASQICNSNLRRRLSDLSVAVMALLVTVPILQISGYVGPSPSALLGSPAVAGPSAEAPGLLSRGVLDKTARSSRAGATLLSAMTYAQKEVARHGGNLGQWWYIVPVGSIYSIKAALWFNALNGDPSNNQDRKVNTQLVSLLDTPAGTRVSSAVREVVAHFGPPRSHGLHLIVPRWLANGLVNQDRRWGAPGLLIVTDQLLPPGRE